MAKTLLCLMAGLCLVVTGYAQSGEQAGGVGGFPTQLFSKINAQATDLNGSLTKATQTYLARMERREQKLQRKLSKVDSNAARSLFAGSQAQYAALSQKLAADTGGRDLHLSGAYQPYVDSVSGMLHYFQQHSSNLSPGQLAQLQQASSQFQAMQAKLQDADQVKAFISQRKQEIGNYIQQHANLSSVLGKQYQGMNQDLYYYSQQVRQYKEMLNDPDKMEKEALALLGKLPAFQAFMKQNSQLAGLFGLPANYGTPQGLAGLQTRDQIGALIQDQVSAGGAGGADALQSNLQSAESQLDGYKDKLSKLGAGSGDMDLPDFKPNDQKTKTFWKRLEYGTNFQTTRDNYYFPTVTDFGLSVGYKLSDRSTLGVGASYKLGWGNGIQHIALSNEGVGLRSFLDIKIKGSFSATGGFEYNYTTPFASYQDLRVWNDWTKSGLVGVTKTVSMKNRFFKKTSLQLLWDFLSYQQVPKTQPILFRIGYNF